MFDYSKLKGWIYEKYGSVKDFCGTYNFNYNVMQRRLRTGAPMKTSDIARLLDESVLSRDAIIDYFFTERVR